MKTTVFILSTVIAIFVLGCQDNSSMNPVADQQLSSAATSLNKPAPNPNIIQLKGLLRDPLPFNSFVEINGQVEFSITGQALMEISLRVAAELKPWWGAVDDDRAWKVSHGTYDRIKILAGNSVSMEKAYLIEGRKDGTFLHLTFMITRDKFGNSQPVTLVGMRLQRHPIPIQPDAATQ
jgi:hypothetical protein